MEMRTLRTGARFAGQASVLLTVLLVAPVFADPDVFEYDGQKYNFSIVNVPDFDQKRAFSRDGTVHGLPNDGKMYCAPTSDINWMAYIANHGYPAVSPGPGNWEVSPPVFTDEYNFITTNIEFMGGLIGTDPFKGGPFGRDAVEAWLEAFAPGQFIVAEVDAAGDWSPRVRDASMAAFFGGLVNIAMGWYTNAGEDEAHLRSGGHVVSLVGAGDDGVAPNFLFMNNPGRGGDQTGTDDSFVTQSPFGSNGSQFEPETQYFCNKDSNGFPSGCVVRTQDRLLNVGSGYMDGYLAIFPKYGLTYVLENLILLTPIQLDGRGFRRGFQTIPSATGGRVLDVAASPIFVRHPYLIEGSDTIWQVDVVNGVSSAFARATTGPLRLTYGGTKGNLYVLTPRQLECFDRNGRRTRNLGLQSPLDAIAFDERNQTLVGLSRAGGRMYFFDSSLRRLGSLEVPDGVLGSDGRLSLTINPATGEMWTLSEGARFVNRLERAGRFSDVIEAHPVSLPAELASPEALNVDERGTLFVTSEGRIYPLDGEGRLLAASPFLGMPGGAALQIARPFSNFDPALHTGPSWINILPEDAVPPIR
jgi:hypothetical protein